MVLVRRLSRWWTVVVALVTLVSVAALVVSVIALTRQSVTAPATAPTEESTPTSATAEPVAIDELDTALCEAIGPLMKESNDGSNEFATTGLPGSSERDAAIPEFRETTLDWAERTQAVMDDHAGPPRFLTRTLQRFVDDMSLYVRNIRPGPPVAYDEAIWTDATAAYGGPLSRCQELGVKW